MARPERGELIRRFFPELGRTGTGGETEAAIEINTRACEVILADMIRIFDKHHQEHGDGALCLKLADGDRESFYVTLGVFCQDLIDAEKFADQGTASFLKEVIAAIKGIDASEKIIVLLLDNSRGSLLPIPREHPARQIEALQKAATL